MATTGQTINDRLNAVRYALVGQGLARTVCKATTEEVLGPKKKHIDCKCDSSVRLLQLTLFSDDPLTFSTINPNRFIGLHERTQCFNSPVGQSFN